MRVACNRHEWISERKHADYLYNVQDEDEWNVHVYDIMNSVSEQKWIKRQFWRKKWMKSEEIPIIYTLYIGQKQQQKQQ